VGVQSGYSVAAVVKGLGLKVDDAARTAEANLSKLAFGRFEVAALQAKEADQVLQRKPALAQAVQRLEPLLQERPYYMIFSRNFVARSKRPLPLWWREVVAVRDSPAYRKAEAEALRALEEAP
jgi:polar amino acid transport system substrate-binding protein